MGAFTVLWACQGFGGAIADHDFAFVKSLLDLHLLGSWHSVQTQISTLGFQLCRRKWHHLLTWGYTHRTPSSRALMSV